MVVDIARGWGCAVALTQHNGPALNSTGPKGLVDFGNELKLGWLEREREHTTQLGWVSNIGDKGRGKLCENELYKTGRQYLMVLFMHDTIVDELTTITSSSSRSTFAVLLVTAHQVCKI